MVRKIALVVAALAAAVLVAAATRPDTFHVQRTVTVKAPPEKIFPLIEDFHRWGAWSPYEKVDPAMSRTYEGAVRGRGAVYAWAGNGRAGQGSMEITQAAAPRKIVIRLDFVKPFESRNEAEFTLEPRGEFTNVTWAMYGPSPYVAKVMGIFLSMDRMIGRDFEAGLASLKELAEREGASSQGT